MVALELEGRAKTQHDRKAGAAKSFSPHREAVISPQQQTQVGSRFRDRGIHPDSLSHSSPNRPGYFTM